MIPESPKLHDKQSLFYISLPMLILFWIIGPPILFLATSLVLICRLALILWACVLFPIQFIILLFRR